MPAKDIQLLAEAYYQIREQGGGVPSFFKSQMAAQANNEPLLTALTKLFDDLKDAYGEGNIQTRTYLENFHETNNRYFLDSDTAIDPRFVQMCIKKAQSSPQGEAKTWPTGEALKQEVLAQRKFGDGGL
jgi:hypothetical protein